MKKFVLLGFVLLSCCLTNECFSQEEEVEVQGPMIQAGVRNVFGNIGLLVGGRYWDKYWGSDFNLGVSRYSFDVNGTDLSKMTTFSFSPALLVGFPIKQFKPHFRFGFSYDYAKNSVANITLKSITLDPSIGVDFAVTEHLLLGVDVMAFPFTVWGKYNGIDVGGNSFNLLNAFRIAYIF